MNRWAGLVAALILAGFGIGVAAQQAAPLQTELLTEVRLLRQSIEALAGTNARVQIVFGRLQLQEQRTATAATRALDAAARLPLGHFDAPGLADGRSMFKSARGRGRGHPSANPSNSKQARLELKMMTRES